MSIFTKGDLKDPELPPALDLNGVQILGSVWPKVSQTAPSP
jgi:hypothetical protein